MQIIKSKNGLGLPVVLAILALVIGSTATFLSYIFFQSRLSDTQIEESENYQNAMSDVSAAIHMIARDQNLDPTYLNQLESLLNVDIDTYGTSLYVVSSRTLVGSSPIKSYLTGAITSVNTYDSIFKYTGAESNFNLSPLVTPTNLAMNYLPTYITTNFHWITPQTAFTDFQSVVSYIRTLALVHNGFNYYKPKDLENQWDPTAWWHWYIDGSVTIPNDKNLTVPEGRILVIDGNLTMNRNSTIFGNVIVNGNVTINRQGSSVQGIRGTLYIKGNLVAANNLNLGTQQRPTFVFAEGDVSLGNTTSGYGYFLSTNFTQRGSISLTGGIYATFTPSLTSQVLINPTLDTSTFFEYGIPAEIAVEPSSGETGQTGFIFTTPKLG